jgi:hypothetical protein
VPVGQPAGERILGRGVQSLHLVDRVGGQPRQQRIQGALHVARVA